MSSSSTTADVSALQKQSYRANPVIAWVVVLTAGLFFLYDFIQINMFDAINAKLMQTFHLNAAQLGYMSSLYFIANVAFLLPAGWLLDRYSPRNMLLLFLGFCIVGTLVFSQAYQLWVAYLGRFLVGIGGAFCFLGAIRVASRWFEPRHMALVTGFLVTMAMVGGMLAQTPLVYLVDALTWRHALLVDVAVGLVVWVLIFIIVKDCPKAMRDEVQREVTEFSGYSYPALARMAFMRWNNWLAGLYSSLMNMPICVLGGLWGSMYLQGTHHFSHVESTMMVSMLFLGTIVGSPTMGWFSDRMGLRRMPMLMATMASLFVMLIIIFIPSSSVMLFSVLFFCLGFFTAAQVIGYPAVAENSRMMLIAMSVSVVNICVMGLQAIYQPLFGWLMDKHAQDYHHATWHHYLPGDFHWAIAMIVVGFVLAFMAAYGVRETYCKHMEES